MEPPPDDLPEPLRPYWVPGGALETARSEREERAGRDSLGNAGHIVLARHVARLSVRRPRAAVVDALVQAGLEVREDGHSAAELSRPPRDVPTECLDPFLLEDSVRVLVAGRELPDGQRRAVEAKLESLRRELADPDLPASRRPTAERILEELETGLASTVEVRCVVQRFTPTVVVDSPRDTIGDVVPVSVGTRLVYRVNPLDSDAGEEGEAEPMVFHVVGLGAREAVMLYAGGVHGMRHLSDLEDSDVHHAWFSNRERARTAAAAPWIGRRVFRELCERGTSEIVIHPRRDPEPVAIEKVGSDQSYVRIDGRPLEVPVVRARTSRDDDLVILDDPASPLVLRLVESGAELVRTIDAVLSPPGRRFRFPGDDDFARAAAEVAARVS